MLLWKAAHKSCDDSSIWWCSYKVWKNLFFVFFDRCTSESQRVACSAEHDQLRNFDLWTKLSSCEHWACVLRVLVSWSFCHIWKVDNSEQHQHSAVDLFSRFYWANMSGFNVTVEIALGGEVLATLLALTAGVTESFRSRFINESVINRTNFHLKTL